MDFVPSDEQRQLIAAFAEIFGDLSTPADVAAAEPLGHDPKLWRQLQQTGVAAMAVAEECGGAGATFVDLVLVAEQYGRFLAPGPVIETQVAARLLARCTGALADEALKAVLDGDRTVTLALRPAENGRALLVPAGAVADDVVVLTELGFVLVPAEANRTVVANMGDLPLADVDVPADAPRLEASADAAELLAHAVDEWRALTAAALQGLAARALEIGVEYTKQRTAFGKPIGGFQSVAHRLADRATEVSGAELLSRKAGWALDAEPERFGQLAAMALGFAAETARDTTYAALHYHGGYGFMNEYPIQMYFRRARTWAAVLEAPADSFRIVGERSGA
jgi:alkylation response protein AidB-like acyl-CoA dehydrogenase